MSRRGHRFSETGYSELFGKHGSFKEYEQAAELVTHGLSAESTDKLAAYKNALKKYMKDIPYVYLQIVKRRVKGRLITVKKVFVKGADKDFPGKSQNTSFIERLNLTLRQHVSYLRRKTLGYCKSKVNFAIVMWINLFNYNYIQLHKSLRMRINDDENINNVEKFVKKYEHNTPAMRIGLTNSPLNWRYLLTCPIPRE